MSSLLANGMYLFACCESPHNIHNHKIRVFATTAPTTTGTRTSTKTTKAILYVTLSPVELDVFVLMSSVYRVPSSIYCMCLLRFPQHRQNHPCKHRWTALTEADASFFFERSSYICQLRELLVLYFAHRGNVLPRTGEEPCHRFKQGKREIDWSPLTGLPD